MTHKQNDAIELIVNGAGGFRTRYDNYGYQDFRYIFLIGAGASFSSDIPGGLQISESFMSEYNITEEMIEKEIAKDPNLSRYQAVLRIVQEGESAEHVSEHIRNFILKARRPEPDFRWKINSCYNGIASIIVNRKYFSRVAFTTNFDPLLHYAFIQNFYSEPVLIRHSQEIENNSFPKGIEKDFPVLMYLHGYWQNHHLFHDATQFQNFHDTWIKLLTKEWNSNHVIVLGYSGLENSIATKWLKNCLSQPSDIKVWWCYYCANEMLSNDDQNKMEKIRSNLNCYDQRLEFILIKSADQFILDLGSRLDIEYCKNISCVNKIFDWFYPSDISKFNNGATIRYYPGTDYLKIDFESGNDLLPGNNHAGLNIDTVKHVLDINHYNEIELDYEIRFEGEIPKDSPGFEFKLHSENSGWSYHIPIQVDKRTKQLIDLNEFRKKDINFLKNIWRLVIACDVKTMGINNKLSIMIYKCERRS